MRYRVGMAEMKVASQAGDIIETNPLGSGLGIAAHDPDTGVGGVLQVMLPSMRTVPEECARTPLLFVDRGMTLFMKALIAEGAEKERLVIKVAGGAKLCAPGERDIFPIGTKNVLMLKKLFIRNGMAISGEEIGGRDSRILHLEIGTGRTWLTSGTRIRDL